eukprot:4625188-Amphidinium_carterae.1
MVRFRTRNDKSQLCSPRSVGDSNTILYGVAGIGLRIAVSESVAPRLRPRSLQEMDPVPLMAINSCVVAAVINLTPACSREADRLAKLSANLSLKHVAAIVDKAKTLADLLPEEEAAGTELKEL